MYVLLVDETQLMFSIFLYLIAMAAIMHVATCADAATDPEPSRLQKRATATWLCEYAETTAKQ